jgi:hypothetical protein
MNDTTDSTGNRDYAKSMDITQLLMLAEEQGLHIPLIHHASRISPPEIEELRMDAPGAPIGTICENCSESLYGIHAFYRVEDVTKEYHFCPECIESALKEALSGK